MYRKLDNKGQSSAEVILILGGLLAIVLFVASYITNITTTTNNSFKELITQEKDFLINSFGIINQLFEKKIKLDNCIPYKDKFQIDKD